MSNADKKDFTSLDTWKKAHNLKLRLYNEVLPQLPNDEKYNLADQIKRAAISSTANVAEGYGRYNYQESIQFYRISRGSLYELKDHLISCRDLKYITGGLFNSTIKDLEESVKLLNGYIRYIQGKKDA